MHACVCNCIKFIVFKYFNVVMVMKLHFNAIFFSSYLEEENSELDSAFLILCDIVGYSVI